MDILVDGVIYQLQGRGGISRIFTEILPRMCARDPSVTFTVLSRGGLKQPIPVHQRIAHHPEGIFGRLARRLRPRLEEGVTRVPSGWRRPSPNGSGPRIWHSTYFTLPDAWEGPSIVTVADMIYEMYPRLFTGKKSDRLRDLKRQCMMQADLVLSISETTKQDILTHYKLDPGIIRVVPLAHSDIFTAGEPTSRVASPPLQRPFILYVGSRVHYKNFDLLLQTYARWPGRKEIALVTVGKSWTLDERRHLEQMKIEDRALALTDVSDEVLRDLYREAVAFVYPSLYEGFGIPLLEAISCGCPVIASRIPSTVEVAGDCPIYFEPDSGDDLLSALDRAVSEGMGSERVRRGHDRAASFSWDRTAEGTLAAYRELSR